MSCDVSPVAMFLLTSFCFTDRPKQSQSIKIYHYNENEKGHIYQSYKNRCSVENNCFITKLLLKSPEVGTPPPRLGTTALLCNDPANGDGYSSSLGIQVVLVHNENNVGRNICKHLLALGKI